MTATPHILRDPLREPPAKFPFLDEEKENRIMIIDSMALLFRGFYATAASGRIMQTSTGVYTNAIYQFIKYMLDAVRTFRPTYVTCAFDMGKHTFRNDLYPEYKANRHDPPVELVPQFDLIREVIGSFDIPQIGVAGYEADDIMGTLASQYSKKGMHVLLLTGDGDTLQLINQATSVVMMKKGFANYEVVHSGNLYEIKGVHQPEQIIDLKALMGDPSDNIPGCPGVGLKTAQRLLSEFESLDRIFAEIGQISGKLKEKLQENKELIYLSKDLATIRTDVQIDCTLDHCRLVYDSQKVREKFDELEFHSLRSWI